MSVVLVLSHRIPPWYTWDPSRLIPLCIPVVVCLLALFVVVVVVVVVIGRVHRGGVDRDGLCCLRSVSVCVCLRVCGVR